MQDEDKPTNKHLNAPTERFSLEVRVGLDNRRRHDRFEPPIGRAFIYLDARIPLIECEVLNLSDGGAKVYALGNFMLPSHFVLFFTLDGSRRRTCRVIWRDGPNLGVSFEDEH